MSVILQPQVDFPITRQIANHVDVATYYVQAKVYNADGILINTVNLVDKTGQRFTKRWRVPVDAGNQGAYISIITSVYTDSGYTTKSNNYGDEENTYLIYDRLLAKTGAGGAGGGSSVSKTDIKNALRDVWDEKYVAPEATEAPEKITIPNYSKQLTELVVGIKSLEAHALQIKEMETDLYPVLEGIQNLADAIDNKNVTPETNLDPIIEGMDLLSRLLDSQIAEQSQLLQSGHVEILQKIADSVDESMSKAKYVNEIVVQPTQQPKEAEVPQEPFNMRKLV
jgi:hypothetical protein